MKAGGSVFDGYQLLSMIAYAPKLLPCVSAYICVCVLCVCPCMNAMGSIDNSVSVGLGGDRSGWSPLLFLKQMHLQLALSEEREGKHAAGVEICFGSSALMALDLCRRL